jgi:hypothetical protein
MKASRIVPLIRQLPKAQLAAASEAAQGRMKKKVLSAEEALKERRLGLSLRMDEFKIYIKHTSRNGTVIQ